jgi:hypothetical protein
MDLAGFIERPSIGAYEAGSEGDPNRNSTGVEGLDRSTPIPEV